jgi:hypothetical protein
MFARLRSTSGCGAANWLPVGRGSKLLGGPPIYLVLKLNHTSIWTSIFLFLFALFTEFTVEASLRLYSRNKVLARSAGKLG